MVVMLYVVTFICWTFHWNITLPLHSSRCPVISSHQLVLKVVVLVVVYC